MICPKCQIIKYWNIVFKKKTCFSWIKLIPVLVHLKYWYYDFPYLPPSSSLSNFNLANWNPSSTQSSSCSLSVSLFCPTPCNHTLPQVLDIPNHVAIQSSQIYYQVVYRSWYLMDQTCYASKSWVFKSRFSFKVRQHGQ